MLSLVGFHKSSGIINRARVAQPQARISETFDQTSQHSGIFKPTQKDFLTTDRA
jgi:hypothetical protein